MILILLTYFFRTKATLFQQARPYNPLNIKIVGVLDGFAIKFTKPNIFNAQDFRNRKGFYALIVQAVCDAER
jgi:hypothetical protein